MPDATLKPGMALHSGHETIDDQFCRSIDTPFLSRTQFCCLGMFYKWHRSVVPELTARSGSLFESIALELSVKFSLQIPRASLVANCQHFVMLGISD